MKPIEEFRKNKGTCLPCAKNYEKEMSRKRWRENGGRMREYAKNRYQTKKKEISEKYKIWYGKNRELRIEKAKDYSKKNKEKVYEQHKEWREKNTEHWKLMARLRYKEKMKTDPEFRLKNSLRIRILVALRKTPKSNNTAKLLGCSIEDLKKHLEKQFTKGMTWENHGLRGWHVDHIIPCSAFDLTKENEQKKCFNYMNLQPLWAKDNLTKKDKIKS